MRAKSLLSFPSLEEGVLIKRYKRFLADVELKNGQIVTAHCANTGPMTGVLEPGGLVRLRYAPSPKRKLAWSWEQSRVSNSEGISCWVGVNTSLPNKLVLLAIEAGLLKCELGPIKSIRKEVVYGLNNRSRIDLLIEKQDSDIDSRTIFIEVKNTTWVIEDEAYFPDTVTVRGQKHLNELIGVMPESRGVLIPCISRDDVAVFAPGDSADPLYGETFRKALKFGLEVIPCSFGFHLDHVTWEGTRPWKHCQKN
tara:strand:- start:1650 stop:2408 length:759 start_codon:yes stop_codon:yes gene_type:complete